MASLVMTFTALIRCLMLMSSAQPGSAGRAAFQLRQSVCVGHTLMSLASPSCGDTLRPWQPLLLSVTKPPPFSRNCSSVLLGKSLCRLR